MAREIIWVDGVASAVMGVIVLQFHPNAIPVHCDLGESTHKDSHRFIDDMERYYGKEILRIKSSKFNCIDDVFNARRYLSGINGAPCTSEMKVAPRLDFQLPSDINFWGYTNDGNDIRRFENMLSNFPNLKQKAPLIERALSKKDCHIWLENFGIKRPYVYDIGYPNGNCLGCVKASAPSYWALTRKFFPDVFERRAEQSRKFGAKLTRLNGERIYLDELPIDYPIKGETSVPSCGFLCEG